MYKIKEAIIVEGNYDKIKLSGFIDGIILTTHGFAIYSNDEFINIIKDLAQKTGIVILTDSDFAGMKIRNFIKNKVGSGVVLDAYVPDIKGRERRKTHASSAGLLGVEGMTEEIIIKALKDAGCEIDDTITNVKTTAITHTDLYTLGLSGGSNSKELRKRLAKELNIPRSLSSNMLRDLLDRLYTYDELVEIIQRISK